MNQVREVALGEDAKRLYTGLALLAMVAVRTLVLNVLQMDDLRSNVTVSRQPLTELTRPRHRTYRLKLKPSSSELAPELARSTQPS